MLAGRVSPLDGFPVTVDADALLLLNEVEAGLMAVFAPAWIARGLSVKGSTFSPAAEDRMIILASFKKLRFLLRKRLIDGHREGRFVSAYFL